MDRDPIAAAGVGFQHAIAWGEERRNRHPTFQRYLLWVCAVVSVINLALAVISRHHRAGYLGQAVLCGYSIFVIAWVERRRRRAGGAFVAPAYITPTVRNRHAGVVLICGVLGGVLATFVWPTNHVVAIVGIAALMTFLVAFNKISLNRARRRYEG